MIRWGGVGTDKKIVDEDTRQAKRFLIGDLLLDTGKHEISRDGKVLDVSGLSYQLFVALAEAAPNVVSHDELVGRVWPGKVIGPETITQRIKLVRQAIGDDAQHPCYIGLVRGQGYRMLADVEALAPEEEGLGRGLFSELGRRRVVQVALIYAAVAWSITEVLSFLFEALPMFPQWSKALVAMIFVIGFPVAMILAWRFDIGPGGITRTQAVSSRDPITVAAALLLLIGATAGLFYLIYPRVSEQADLMSAREEALAEAVAAYKTNKSIAVLPFADLSPNQDQEYFADGIAEQLLDELTRLEGLNVASGTSSFAFKGSDQGLKSIGEQLGVTNILEGSVRKADDQLRITAQLVDTRTDSHLWSKTFDRQIDDIFFIQEDIARSVAAALGITLEIDGRDHLMGAGTTSIEAYDAFLAGGAWERVGKSEHAQPYFEQAVKLDPDYAEAWSALGLSIALQWDEQPSEQIPATLQRGRELILRAIELNPVLTSAWINLARVNRNQGDWMGAVEAGQKAVALAPGHIGLQMISVGFFGSLGHVREYIKVSELYKEIRPLGYYGAQDLAEKYIQAGRYDDARATLEVSEALSSPTNPSIIKRHLFIALSERKPEDIRKFLEQFAAARPAAGPMIRLVLAEFESSPAVILAVLHRYFEEATDMPGQGRVIMAGLAAYYGDSDFALEVVTEELNRSRVRLRRLWYPFFSDMRRLQGFKGLLIELGLEDFYRKYNWPDFCQPLKGDDFECF